MVRVGGFVAAERAQERKDVIADDLVHLAGLAVLELRPAQILVRRALPILTLGEDDALDGLAGASSWISSSRRMKSR